MSKIPVWFEPVSVAKSERIVSVAKYVSVIRFHTSPVYHDYHLSRMFILEIVISIFETLCKSCILFSLLFNFWWKGIGSWIDVQFSFIASYISYYGLNG